MNRWILSIGALLLSGSVFADDYMISGQASGNGKVSLNDAFTGNFIRAFLPFGTGYTGGVYVAAGDINGDGRDDVIVGAGSGGGPHVRVFDGNTGTILRDFFAYDMGFTGGVRVASGDLNGDGFDDIVTGSGPGAVPTVKVFSGFNNAVIGNMLTPGLQAYVAVAEGPGWGPSIVVGNDTALQTYTLNGTFGISIVPYSGFTGGVRVAAGDVNGDGIDDLITGPAGSLGPFVKGFSGTNQTLLHAFFAFNSSFSGGVSVSAGDFDNNGTEEFVAAMATGGGLVYCFDGGTANQKGSIVPFGPSYTGGIEASFAEDEVGSAIKVQSSANNPVVPMTVWQADLKGRKDASTTFTRLYSTSTNASFTAPLSDDGMYFDNWSVDDGAPMLARTITVSASSPHSLIASYLPGRTLSVTSANPSSGVPIKIYTADKLGHKDGTTAFNRIYTQGTTVSLTAPAIADGDHYFMRWDLAGVPFSSNRTISLLMGSSDRTLIATYGTGFYLHVGSTEPQVPITVWTRDRAGLTDGTTPFDRLYSVSSAPAITAPATANSKPFKDWKIDGVVGITGKRTVNVSMNAEHTVIAEYGP